MRFLHGGTMPYSACSRPGVANGRGVLPKALLQCDSSYLVSGQEVRPTHSHGTLKVTSNVHPMTLPRGHDVRRPTGTISSVSKSSKLFSQGAFCSGEKRNAGSTEAGSSRLLSVKLTWLPVMFR